MSQRLFLYSLLLISPLALAATHTFVAPACLMEKIPSSSYQRLAESKKMMLFSGDDQLIEALIKSRDNKNKNCAGFIDYTADWLAYSQTHGVESAKQFLELTITPHKYRNPRKYRIQHREIVEKVIAQINPQAMWDNLTTLTNFNDRYANSDNGVAAAEWLKKTMLDYAAHSQREDVSATLIPTGNFYSQPSVVIKIGTSTEAGIVIGAHMDTLSGTFGKKPGADDDGSGTVTVLEAARTLLDSQLSFKKPIYIIWYAAEEEGLVGSGYVVKDFVKNNIPIEAVLHFDLTGYAYHNEPTMWLITDNVDPKLTNYLGRLITTYVKKPIQRTACGYACSDHASWTQAGFAAAIPAEAAYEHTNPVIHSSQDAMERLSLEHMTDYTKLAVAFAVELAQPNEIGKEIN